MTVSSCFLALALVLPLLTGQVPKIGNMLCPMHLPVMLCGYLCGPVWGACVGLVAPLLRFVVFGAPEIMPRGIAMSAELAAYGLSIGLLGYWLRPLSARGKKGYVAALYLSLIGSMLAGRVIWGLVQLLLAGLNGSSFLLSAFWTRGFVNAVPGIILQLILFPLLIPVLERLPVIKNAQGNG